MSLPKLHATIGNAEQIINPNTHTHPTDVGEAYIFLFR